MLPAAGLQDLDWMTGGSWKATAKSPDGKNSTDVVNTFRIAANKKAMLFTTTFNGIPHYDGFYAWDPAANCFRFLYTSSNGEMTTGTARVEGDTLKQEFEITQPDGKKQTLRSDLVRRGPDLYHWNVQRNREGKWTEIFSLDYTRSK